MNYTSKYFKYKHKYLTLKNVLEGGVFDDDGSGSLNEHAKQLLLTSRYLELSQDRKIYRLEDILEYTKEIFPDITNFFKDNNNFKKIKVRPDGNCFYYCCELFLYNSLYYSNLLNREINRETTEIQKLIDIDNTELRIKDIRLKIIDYIIANYEDYIHYFYDYSFSPADDFTYDKYLGNEQLKLFNLDIDKKLYKYKDDVTMPNLKKKLFLTSLNTIWAELVDINAFAKIYNINIKIFDTKDGITDIISNDLKQFNFFLLRHNRNHFDFLFYYNIINDQQYVYSGFNVDISANLSNLIANSIKPLEQLD